MFYVLFLKSNRQQCAAYPNQTHDHKKLSKLHSFLNVTLTAEYQNWTLKEVHIIYA